MKRLVLALAAACMAASASAQLVDLGDSMLYIRPGFEDAWTRKLPRVDDETWTILAPRLGKERLRMRDLDLPGVPKGGVFSLIPGSPREYTVLVPFQADLTLLNASDPALFLKHVGQEWAVYLNGVLLRNEFSRSGSGYAERSLRDVVVPLDKRRLARGENVLAFRLRGDPFDDTTGFDGPAPYVIDSYRSLAADNREYVDLMLIGVYAFFALYHGVLFALRRKDTGYLFFAVSALLFALRLSARINASASIITDTAALRRIEYLSLFLALPAFLAFLERLVDARAPGLIAVAAVASAALSVAGLFLRLEPISIVWYGLAALAVAYASAAILGKAVVRDIRSLAAAGRSPLALAGTDTGRLIIGLAALAAAVSADAAILLAAGEPFWSKYAFFGFMLLASSILAGQFAKVSARAEAMNAGLELEVGERTAELSTAAAERMRLNAELSTTNASLTEAMKEAERDLSVAAAVQRGFFPKRPPATSDWDVACVFEPATGVSGDFYDFYERDGSLAGLVIGTVSGSGIAGGIVTVLAKNVFSRVMAESEGLQVSAMLSEINLRLGRELSAVGNTVSAAFMRIRAGKLEYVNAAHPDVFLRRAGARNAAAVQPKDGSWRYPPLGRGDSKSGGGTLSLSLRRGDAIIACTAGLTASSDAKMNLYGAERLAQAFGRADPDTAESMLTSVLIDYRNFVAGTKRTADIAAAVLVKR